MARASALPTGRPRAGAVNSRMAYVGPIVLVSMSLVVYQLSQRAISTGSNPWAPLLVAYVVGAAICATALGLTTDSVVAELRGLNVASLVLGLAVVGIGFGYLQAHRAGWNPAAVGLVGSVTAMVAFGHHRGGLPRPATIPALPHWCRIVRRRTLDAAQDRRLTTAPRVDALAAFQVHSRRIAEEVRRPTPPDRAVDDDPVTIDRVHDNSRAARPVGVDCRDRRVARVAEEVADVVEKGAVLGRFVISVRGAEGSCATVSWTPRSRKGGPARDRGRNRHQGRGSGSMPRVRAPR